MATQSEKAKGVVLPWAMLRLPPLPQVAIRVIQLANRESVQLSRISDLISSDPAFAGEVLTIVNSLAYAPRFPINSILQAIAVMGVNHLQGLCLTVGVRGILARSLSHSSVRALWRHNLACAAIAEQMASAGFMDRDTAFTCGVMHDVGRLALAAAAPKEYGELLSGFSGTAASILEQERKVFGKDHCEVGRQLIGEWNLPEDFEAIVAEHHCAPVAGHWGMPEMVGLSCRMADAAGFSAFQGCHGATFAELLEELPARERRYFHADVESLSAEVDRKIQAIESI